MRIIEYIKILLISDSWQAAKIKVEPAVQPSFITQSQVFKVKDQDTVELPCEVANPGKIYFMSIQFCI